MQEVLKWDSSSWDNYKKDISDFLDEKINEGYKIVTVVPEEMDGITLKKLTIATVVVEKIEEKDEQK